MVRPILEYANTIWSPRRISDLTKIEKVQIKATKYVCRNKHLAYEERLWYLNLPTLSYRRIRGDMIELYKIIMGKYDADCGLSLYLRSDIVHASITRGNKFKLVPQHCIYTYENITLPIGLFQFGTAYQMTWSLCL